MNNKPYTQIAGWSAVLDGILLLGSTVLLVALTLARVPVTGPRDILDILEDLAIFPVVFGLAGLLEPHEGAKAWMQAALGGLGFAAEVALRVDSLMHIASPALIPDLTLYGCFFIGAWLAWVNWQMWRNAMLKGALPWIGVACGVAYVLYSGSSGGLVGAAISLILYITLITWSIWLGVLLIRDQVKAIAGT